MSLSGTPAIQITFNTTQDISDEILGGAIHFCRKAGYNLNITMLTFSWSAFLFNARSELTEHGLVENVMGCYGRSLGKVFPQLSEDTEMRQNAEKKRQHYWGILSADFVAIKTTAELSAFARMAYKINCQDNMSDAIPLKENPKQLFVEISDTINSSIYCILRQINNGFGIRYRGILDQFRYASIHQETGARPKNNTPKKTVSSPVKPLTNNSIYCSRTETDQSIVIVWKPFSTYSTYILLAVALVGYFSSVTALSLIAFLLLLVNAVVYSTVCQGPRNEVNEALRNSSVQVKGNKFSLSAPLTVTIPKNDQYGEGVEDISIAAKNGGGSRKIGFGFLTAVFLILGLFVFSAFTNGVRQSAYVGSLIFLLVMALIFFLLAYLCFRKLRK